MSGGDDNQQREDLLKKLLKQYNFPIFPCVHNQKVPAVKGWQEKLAMMSGKYLSGSILKNTTMGYSAVQSTTAFFSP